MTASSLEAKNLKNSIKILELHQETNKLVATVTVTVTVTVACKSLSLVGWLYCKATTARPIVAMQSLTHSVKSVSQSV